MLRGLLSAAIPLALLVLGAAGALLVFLALRLRMSRSRRSPLAQDLLRPPGHSLRVRLDDLDFNISGYIAFFLFMPLLVYAVHVSQSYFGGKPESFTRIVFSTILGMGVTFLFGWKIWRSVLERRKLQQGLDGELAVGEELNRLMLDGCRVFHDIPFPYGNIDHVVVCARGVFTINTKVRGKPRSADHGATAVVHGDEDEIKFPDGRYPLPLAQLQTEARWLQQELSQATGAEVTVAPMLAFPGWFVERKGRPSVCVFNPKNPQWFFLGGEMRLSEERIQQIAHQLERLCRDVAMRPPPRKRW